MGDVILILLRQLAVVCLFGGADIQLCRHTFGALAVRCSFESRRACARLRIGYVLRVEEHGRECGTLEPEVAGDVPEDAREGADAEARVIGDRDMMLAALLRCEAHVTTRFARHRVSVATEGAREIASERSQGSLTRDAHRNTGQGAISDRVGKYDRYRPASRVRRVIARTAAWAPM